LSEVESLTRRSATNTLATIRPSVLRYLGRVVRDYGVDFSAMLERVGLDYAELNHTRLRVSYRQASAVIRDAVKLTGEKHLGLKVGQAQYFTSWGPVGFTLISSETLFDAIEIGVKYQNLTGSMTMSSAGQEESGFSLRVDLLDPVDDPQVTEFLIEEAFSSIVTLLKLTFGPELGLRAVEFACPQPDDTALFKEVFSCEVHFGARRNRIILPNHLVRSPMPGRDHTTHSLALQVLNDHSADRRDQQDLCEVLEISIVHALPRVPSLAEQARRHALSERTLRRRLAECGTNYDEVIDGVRRERVEQLMRRPEMTLREIAREVGFSDVSALRRAVRRWYGLALQQLREGLSKARQTAP
jgi:AraC-like DNA-binding protein